MRKENTDQKNKPELTKKQDSIIGPREICKMHGKTWEEHYLASCGSIENVFYEIDAIKNQRTLNNPQCLLNLIEYYKIKANKGSAIAKMILNPGKWKEHFPTLGDICVKENGQKLVLYQEIDNIKDLNMAIEMLNKEATNKISVLLC